MTFLAAHPIDALFLDIQMPGLNGFQFLERLDRDVAVVFTTAYDRYALNAFDVNSIDYLLKPIEPERLARALDKLERFTARDPTSARSRASWRPNCLRRRGWTAWRRASASARRFSTSRAFHTSSHRTS